MKDRVNGLLQWTVLLCAVLVPWSALAVLPLWRGGLWLLPVLNAVMAVLFIVDIISNRRWQVPFELAWPSAIMLILQTIGPILMVLDLTGVLGSHAGVRTITVSASGFTFLAIVNGMRSRQAIMEILSAFAFSTCAMVLFSVVGPWIGAMPTLWGHNAYTGFIGPRLPVHVVTLMLSALVILFFSHGETRALRIFRGFPGKALLSVAVLVSAFECFLTFRVDFPATRLPLTLAGGLGLVVAVWLCARVGAKLIAGLRERPIEGQKMALGMLLIVLLEFMIGAHWLDTFLLGLVAAYSLPERTPYRITRKGAIVAAGIVVLLVVSQAWRVSPNNSFDPRNYAFIDRMTNWRMFGPKGPDRPAIVFERILNRYPEERLAHYWLACNELGSGRVYGAALEFGRSLEPVSGHRQLLAPPTFEERNLFISAMRDMSSALPNPERTFAFIQVLGFVGNTEDALRVLESQAGYIKSPSIPDIQDPSGNLRRAIVAIAGLTGDASALDKLPSPVLLDLLRAWGAEIEPAPEGFPPDRLPLVMSLQTAPTCSRATVVDTNTMLVKTFRHDLMVSSDDDEPQVDGSWSPLESSSDGLQTAFGFSAADSDAKTAQFLLDKNGAWYITPGTIPATPADSPAIRVVLR